MEIIGRHALLFDDDAMAAFVNSKDALVEWNSLLIDRYDVRHLLNAPPPPIKRRNNPSDPFSAEESQLDEERFLDLPPPSDDSPDQENGGAKPVDSSGYHSVAFSYGNIDVSTDQKNSDVSAFLPPFPVPEDLLQSLPPTEKLHQIMARTAIFVSTHGGQSEIVLRVKQGNNPTFGFLMPDHHLHAYFRFLVDHPELLKSRDDLNPEGEDKKADQEHNQSGVVAGEALSLLGSVYGYGEDEDGAIQIVSEPNEKKHMDVSDAAANASVNNGFKREGSSEHTSRKDLIALKQALHAAKEKSLFIKKIRPVITDSSSTALSKKRESDLTSSHPGPMDKHQISSLPKLSKVVPLLVEPPSDIKRTVDKIVEFILKNGKEFEAVLVEQDSTNGRFPFLLPSHKYHPYYIKVLEKAQESKQAGKSLGAQKPESLGTGSGKVSTSSKADTLSGGSASLDYPCDPERKAKFKMFIGGPKKEAPEPTPKSAQQQCGVSIDAAAAILQAATRGLSHPKLDILPKTSLNNSGLGLGSDGGPTTSFGNISFPSIVNSSTSKPPSKGEASLTIPVDLSGSVGLLGKEGNGARDVSVAKAIAKTAARAAASEADSSEACLTKEQKQKAERLKRAKMFAAMIKSGVSPLTNGPPPRLSVEPPDSVFNGLAGSGVRDETQDGSLQVLDASNLSGGVIGDILDREREGSSVPVDVNASDRMHKPEKNDYDDNYKERRSRMKKHLRSRRVEEDDDEEERGHKHSRKKHRPHRSSHHSKDKRKHRKRHSSPKDRDSRHREKYTSTSEDDHRYESRPDKRRRSHAERRVESEDESGRKLSDESNTSRFGITASREASVDFTSNRRLGSASLVDPRPSEPSQTTEVPDELRAKVRAMLLAL